MFEKAFRKILDNTENDIKLNAGVLKTFFEKIILQFIIFRIFVQNLTIQN